jgi:hypothetical protein
MNEKIQAFLTKVTPSEETKLIIKQTAVTMLTTIAISVAVNLIVKGLVLGGTAIKDQLTSMNENETPAQEETPAIE